ncbi:Putative integral membrane protein [Streptomyces clavuligerus]|uniref:Putative integral membrane protein n=5 Tax=Streptomyces clavuligerus TaxID=1901 RepID=E2Q5D6_STRCL|nr:Putative integral membrane protein [Streptomyces clavuligerus]
MRWTTVNDTPGWASPGSADDRNTNPPRPAEPAGSSQWADNQPPPAPWSGQTGGHGAPTPPPAPGWGGGPHHGWGVPVAAKPGVIPLRPLGVTEILEGSVATLRGHWPTVLGITLTVSVFAQLCITAADLAFGIEPVKQSAEPGTDEALREAFDSARVALINALPTMFIGLIVTFLVTALLTMVVSRAVLGRKLSLTEAWQEARPRLPQLLGLTFLLPLIAVAIAATAMAPGLLLGGNSGALLLTLGTLVGMPLMIWVMVRFTLAPTALMLERQGVMAALRRSARLVEGAWWRTFGIMLLTILISFVIQLIVGIPFIALGYLADSGGMSDLMAGRTPDSWQFLLVTGIGAVIGYAISYPLSAGVTALLYIDQRIRRESLDLELARVADLPGSGTPSPTSGFTS